MIEENLDLENDVVPTPYAIPVTDEDDKAERLRELEETREET